MKKSAIYRKAQFAVLDSERIYNDEKLEILRELFTAEDLELYRERQAEKTDEMKVVAG